MSTVRHNGAAAALRPPRPFQSCCAAAGRPPSAPRRSQRWTGPPESSWGSCSPGGGERWTCAWGAGVREARPKCAGARRRCMRTGCPAQADLFQELGRGVVGAVAQDAQQHVGVHGRGRAARAGLPPPARRLRLQCAGKGACRLGLRWAARGASSHPSRAAHPAAARVSSPQLLFTHPRPCPARQPA